MWKVSENRRYKIERENRRNPKISTARVLLSPLISRGLTIYHKSCGFFLFSSQVCGKKIRIRRYQHQTQPHVEWSFPTFKTGGCKCKNLRSRVFSWFLRCFRVAQVPWYNISFAQFSGMRKNVEQRWLVHSWMNRIFYFQQFPRLFSFDILQELPYATHTFKGFFWNYRVAMKKWQR